LFRLIVPEGDLLGNPLDAGNARVSIAGQTATIRYQLEGVEAVATLGLEGPAISATLRISNGGKRTIEETIFPWVRGLAPIPDASLICPSRFGRRTRDPFGAALERDHHTWNEGGQKRVYRYPEHLASAWYDYGNGDRAIALEGRQTDFSIMDFFVQKVVQKTFDPIRRTLDLATVQPRRIKPGETWTSAPVRIVIHQGDWHVVAQSHRDWLSTWVKRPDRPRKFAETHRLAFLFHEAPGWSGSEHL